MAIKEIQTGIAKTRRRATPQAGSSTAGASPIHTSPPLDPPVGGTLETGPDAGSQPAPRARSAAAKTQADLQALRGDVAKVQEGFSLIGAQQERIASQLQAAQEGYQALHKELARLGERQQQFRELPARLADKVAQTVNLDLARSNHQEILAWVRNRVDGLAALHQTLGQRLDAATRRTQRLRKEHKSLARALADWEAGGFSPKSWRQFSATLKNLQTDQTQDRLTHQQHLAALREETRRGLQELTAAIRTGAEQQTSQREQDRITTDQRLEPMRQQLAELTSAKQWLEHRLGEIGTATAEQGGLGARLEERLAATADRIRFLEQGLDQAQAMSARQQSVADQLTGAQGELQRLDAQLRDLEGADGRLEQRLAELAVLVAQRERWEARFEQALTKTQEGQQRLEQGLSQTRATAEQALQTATQLQNDRATRPKSRLPASFWPGLALVTLLLGGTLLIGRFNASDHIQEREAFLAELDRFERRLTTPPAQSAVPAPSSPATSTSTPSTEQWEQRLATLTDQQSDLGESLAMLTANLDRFVAATDGLRHAQVQHSGPESGATTAPPAPVPVPQPAAMATSKSPAPHTHRDTQEPWRGAQQTGWYSIQIGAGRQRDSLLNQPKQMGLEGDLAYLETRRDGKTWYALLMGRYPSRPAAAAALRELAARQDVPGAWVRRLPGAGTIRPIP